MSYVLIVERVRRGGEQVTDRKPYRSYQRACAEARRLESDDRNVTATDVVAVDAAGTAAVRRAWRDVQGGFCVFASRFFSQRETV